MLKFIFALLFSIQGSANYPPTTTKGSADANFITTFNFAFPNVTMTHSGTTATFGVVGTASGGTGLSSITAPAALVANTNNTISAASGSTGARVLRTSGSAVSFSLLELASDVSGILPVANGGTGASTLTANNVILGNGTSAVQFVAPSTSGNVLQSNGTTWQSTALTFSGDVHGAGTSVSGEAVIFNNTSGKDLARATGTGIARLASGVLHTSSGISLSSEVSGTLALANGGTNASITASHGGLVYSTASAMSVGPVGTSGYIATSGGAGAPAWIQKVPEANGGTNQTTYATGDMLYASSANTLSKLAAGTADYILNMSSGVPTWRSSVTSNSTSNIRVESARITGGGDTTACTGSPCTIVRSTSFLSSVTRSGAGSYSLNFSPTWGGVPSCTFVGSSGDSTVFRAESASTSAYVITSRNPTSLADTAFDVICVGVK